MNAIKLSWKNLVNRPLGMLLSIVLFALGVGLISLLLLLNQQLDQKFEKNLAGIDLVIGAKGSPLQLILCNMYHVDAPTGNIDIKDAKPFLRPGHPLIEVAIPLSLGDNYRNFRIVGTEPDFVDLYDAKIETGALFDSHFQVTIGANVAATLGLKIGDTFFSAHGFDHNEDFEHETEQPFEVVGILAPSGAVVDQLILTTPPTIWMVHEHESPEADSGDHQHDDEHVHDHDSRAHTHPAYDQPLLSYPDKQITSILIEFSARNFRTLNMQRNINENTSLQAATPVIEINRLFSLMGVGLETLKVLAWVIVIVSGLSIFISLFNSLKERKYELALMRVMGASRLKLFGFIILEGLLIAVIGYILGILLSHVSISLLSGYMQEAYKYSISGNVFLPEEAYLFLGCLVVGLVSAVIPAWQAFKTDISETLTMG